MDSPSSPTKYRDKAFFSLSFEHLFCICWKILDQQVCGGWVGKGEAETSRRCNRHLPLKGAGNTVQAEERFEAGKGIIVKGNPQKGVCRMYVQPRKDAFLCPCSYMGAMCVIKRESDQAQLTNQIASLSLNYYKINNDDGNTVYYWGIMIDDCDGHGSDMEEYDIE